MRNDGGVLLLFTSGCMYPWIPCGFLLFMSVCFLGLFYSHPRPSAPSPPPEPLLPPFIWIAVRLLSGRVCGGEGLGSAGGGGGVRCACYCCATHPVQCIERERGMRCSPPPVTLVYISNITRARALLSTSRAFTRSRVHDTAGGDEDTGAGTADTREADATPTAEDRGGYAGHRKSGGSGLRRLRQRLRLALQQRSVRLSLQLL